jgi:hypothetical protein
MLHHYRNLSNVTTITPTAVLELRGAFKNHPKQARERAGEPRPTEPLGDPPKRLKPVDKAAWREMQEHGFWLTSADQFKPWRLARLPVPTRAAVYLLNCSLTKY